MDYRLQRRVIDYCRLLKAGKWTTDYRRRVIDYCRLQKADRYGLQATEGGCRAEVRTGAIRPRSAVAVCRPSSLVVRYDGPSQCVTGDRRRLAQSNLATTVPHPQSPLPSTAY